MRRSHACDYLDGLLVHIAPVTADDQGGAGRELEGGENRLQVRLEVVRLAKRTDSFSKTRSAWTLIVVRLAGHHSGLDFFGHS
jgi:hypothetical protein